MRKSMYTVAAIAIIGAFVTASLAIGINPKRMACDKSCNEAFEKCTKEAKDSEAKKAACKVAKDQCLKKCAEKF